MIPLDRKSSTIMGIKRERKQGERKMNSGELVFYFLPARRRMRDMFGECV